MPFQLDRITFYYADKKVIDDFTITLAPGKFYGIIGPNGSGKTTILDLLSKHRQPASGSAGRSLAKGRRSSGDIAGALPPAGDPGRFRIEH